MTHCNVRVVSAEKYLTAFGHHAAVLVYAGVNYRFSSASANGLDLGHGVSDLKKPAATLKEMSKEVCSQPEAENGYIKLVDDASELIDLRRGKELALVRDDYVAVAVSFEFFK